MNKLPNVIMLSGPRGSGKATFAYHFINYMLSQDEHNPYQVASSTINFNNSSYKKVQNNAHPNFSLIEKEESEIIKVENIRKTLNFLNKSSFSKDFRVILIDDANFLNTHSSNALLKSLEDVSEKTFFFIINDISLNILNTIKSRCIEFKLFLSTNKKVKIFNKLVLSYDNSLLKNNVNDLHYLETPGNILKYLFLLIDENKKIFNDNLNLIILLLDKYKKKTNYDALTFATLLIELFYNKLSLNKTSNSNYYFNNKIKLLKKINDTKKFNLDKRNLIISIYGELKNESW